ncbi:indole-3-glycerol phosphate synthase TrpC [Bacillus massilinigeriensis]|uniref:indole-3-glycerol phosphate synthase TrpC n=1 Tax=Bacillus massilionigeriensis TaxID=1805475 RepID=UPI00096B45F4|nr:indole-3-glycerol phosphate synthase TrpC [Bacillus massilionigeriensis]
MGTILDKIIAEKKVEVNKLKKDGKPEIVVERKNRSFIKKLSKATEISIIAEFKRASPSKGDINPSLDPTEQAQFYTNAGADAVSILTDYPFFKGSFDDLRAIRSVIDQPILCKDFVIDPIQIEYAYASGADIILLIAAALDDRELKTLYQYAQDKNLEVLMEVHNEEELERVLKTGNQLIGVNNRDLKTFHVDLAATERLASDIKNYGAFLISESGIKTKEDVERVVIAGANGILVGEAFMTHPNVSKALKEMKIPLKGVQA